jgi:hypothetical protein
MYRVQFQLLFSFAYRKLVASRNSICQNSFSVATRCFGVCYRSSPHLLQKKRQSYRLDPTCSHDGDGGSGTTSGDIGLFSARTGKNGADSRTTATALRRRRRRRPRRLALAPCFDLLRLHHVSPPPIANAVPPSAHDASFTRRRRRDALPDPHALPPYAPGPRPKRTCSRVLAQSGRQCACRPLRPFSTECGQVLARCQLGWCAGGPRCRA